MKSLSHTHLVSVAIICPTVLAFWTPNDLRPVDRNDVEIKRHLGWGGGMGGRAKPGQTLVLNRDNFTIDTAPNDTDIDSSSGGGDVDSSADRASIKVAVGYFWTFQPGTLHTTEPVTSRVS